MSDTLGRFEVTTDLILSFEHVRPQFNQELFEALTQGFPPIHLTRFDGVFLGAETHLRLFSKFGPRWVSVITEFDEKPGALVFVDEGRQLPPGLRYWRHTHVIRATEHGCQIKDSIELAGTLDFLTPIFRVIFEKNMQARRKVYQRYLTAHT